MPTSTAADRRWAVLLDAAPGAGERAAGLALLGGKGAQTATLVELGLAVPRTGVVTTEAYRQAMRTPELAALVASIRSGAALDAEEVDAAFLGTPIPAPLAEEIEALGHSVGGGGRVAVRSSATVEDLGSTSFAGQYRSLLDVSPGPELLDAVRLVWASLWHPAPCAYRRASGVDDDDAAMAVVVMAMVPAVQAGVVFTQDPAGPADHLRVEAVDGLGEALVSGAVTPRCWSLPRAAAAAEPAPVGDAARAALEAEHGFGVPLDVEWAWDGTTTWVVQARPITVGRTDEDPHDTPVDDHELTTAGIAEMLPGVLPPLVWQLAGSAVEEALRASFDALGAVRPDGGPGPPLVRRVRGRAALDLDALSSVAASLPGGSAEAVEHGFFGGTRPTAGAPAPWWRRARHDLRVDTARRRSLHESRVVVAAAARLAAGPPDLTAMDDDRLLGHRRRLVDLGWRAMAAEVGVSAAATGVYDRLLAFLSAHLDDADADRWARRLTVGIGTAAVTERASMSAFAGPTWSEAGMVPPRPAPVAAASDGPAPDPREAGRAALRELEEQLQATRRWRRTRIITGQVVDVRLHLLRRLVAEAVLLLGWRERAKGAVLMVGGEVRASHLELARRLTEAGALAGPADVDLLTDAEVRGDDALPPLAVLGRRRRALQRAAASSSLPERFTGRPAEARSQLPTGDRLVGLAASAGRCTGRARVVRDPRRTKLRHGEVLVAESTDAGWSPLFLDAGAIVVERGGQLSHAAIVARELGVPAVLDVPGATAALDGHIVTVDGDAGVVIVHGEAAR